MSWFSASWILTAKLRRLGGFPFADRFAVGLEDAEHFVGIVVVAAENPGFGLGNHPTQQSDDLCSLLAEGRGPRFLLEVPDTFGLGGQLLRGALAGSDYALRAQQQLAVAALQLLFSGCAFLQRGPRSL